NVRDVGVGIEELLDLARVDVFAATNNHVLDSSRDTVVSVRGVHRQVAGAQPAVGCNRGPCLQLFLVVSLHHAVAAYDELAGFAGCYDIGSTRLDDSHVQAGKDPADGAHAMLQAVRG